MHQVKFIGYVQNSLALLLTRFKKDHGQDPIKPVLMLDFDQ